MNKNYATVNASRAVQAILEGGAERLYDRYLQQKLPNHTHNLNQDQFQTNLKALSLRAGNQPTMEVVATRIVQNIPADNFAPKRIAIKRTSIPSSFSPNKESQIDKSTKYQTVIQSHRTIQQPHNHSKEIQDSMLLQEESKHSPIFARTERPSTMQVGRSQARDDNIVSHGKVIGEEKRAATCHVRKRKSFAVQQAEKKKFVKLHEELPFYLQDDMQTFSQLRQERDERMQEEELIERHHAQETARQRMKQMRQKEHFEALQKKAKGKGKINVPVTNFECQTGEIVINGRPKVPQAHIIELQFNPEEEQLQSKIESKYSSVNPTKTKSFFSTKLKRKMKISDQQFTNNGSRQTSSIPFVTLSYGIVISEDGLQATASRRRPENELTRSKYVEEQPSKFKSHIPIVNSARINIFTTLDAEPTARSAIMEHPHLSISQDKNLETTIESNMQRSLLWNPRGRSEGKSIRVSNRELLQREVLQSKLALAHG